MNRVGFYSLLRKEVKRFMSVIAQTIISPMISSALYLFIFGVSLAKSIQAQGGVSYLVFLIPGVTMMAMLNNAYTNSTSSIIISKFHGDLQDLRTAPLSPNDIIAAYTLGGVARGFILGIGISCVGQLLHFMQYGQWLIIQSPLWLLSFAIIGTLIFAQLGISIAFWADNFDKVNGVGAFILVPLIYLGGVFFSLEALHPTWQMISKLNPMLYLINGFRYGFLGKSDVDPVLCILYALIALVLTYLLAQRFIRHGSYTRF